MSTTSLTAKYRPQTFAEVAGQGHVKAILSRAAAQNKVAPAYLFSGTRGVGKTTIARIFAKALNCKQAPTAEPCNQCPSCKQITAGVAVDVIEIDAASNRGIDDARRLKEDIGYAPLEAPYKVFIIDEAHMLTREAFNALLKTLEEPPPRVTFILATTEAHKFPATIISRCQHYIFKMLPQPELAEHLRGILEREGIEYEPAALQLIAKRGAGSVRDSMSLLGQVLAMGGERLEETEVRSFLGLAGQDVFLELMGAIHGRDLAQVGRVLRQVLDQGLDLGFFMRELAGCWRNMFLLRQAGDGARELLDLSDEDAAAWAAWAGRFEPSFIHAAWQMTLEGQQRVKASLDPAMALELLLLNLASMPDLVSLAGLAPSASGTGRGGPGSGGSPQGGQGGFSGPSGPGPRQAAPRSQPTPQVSAPAPKPPRAEPAPPVQEPVAPSPPAPEVRPSEDAPAPAMAEPVAEPVPELREPAPALRDGPPPGFDDAPPPTEDTAPSFDGPAPGPEEDGAKADVPAESAAGPDWEGFVARLAASGDFNQTLATQLGQCRGNIGDDRLTIVCRSKMMLDKLCDDGVLGILRRHAAEYFGRPLPIEVVSENGYELPSMDEMEREVDASDAVRNVMELFGAQRVSAPQPRTTPKQS